MALYDLPLKDQITTLKILLEISEGIKTLNQNPEYLTEVIEKAYALTDQEQKKLEVAKNEISKYEDIVREQKTNLAVLLDEANKLDLKKAELNDLQKNIDALRGSLSSEEKRLNVLKLQVQADQDTLTGDRNRLESEKQKLIQDRLLLDKERKDFEVYESSVKEKADQLKALAGGL